MIVKRSSGLLRRERERVAATRRAFTLLEILVVLAVLGMGMGLITQMTLVASRHSERVEEDTFVQLACENMMSSILAGNMTATVGVSTPIPDAPNWETTIELLDGPIEKLVAIRITAQRYAIEEYPSQDGSGFPISVREPEDGRRFVIKEYARRADIKTRVVQTNAQGEMTATDGTGETFANDLLGQQNAMGGGLGMDALDPFAAVDRGMAATNGGNNNVGGGLGGGVGGLGGMTGGFGGDNINVGGGLGGGNLDRGFGNLGF